MSLVYETALGAIHCADSLEYMRSMQDASVDLVVTSPPYALVVPRAYGNVLEQDYLEWFRPFASEVRRVLKDTGSFVVNLAGTWSKGTPTRSLYIYKLPVMMCEELGFYLAQDYYWYHPDKLTTSTWVTGSKIRVKDSVEQIYWFSRTPWPKASNRRVLQPYAATTPEEAAGARTLDEYAGNDRPVGKVRRPENPSGHRVYPITRKFEGSIPPNLLSVSSARPPKEYKDWCALHCLPVHPAQYSPQIPDYFIRFLTDPGDLVFDPFAGSCTTGYAAEAQGRRWLCVEKDEAYCKGAVGRFKGPAVPPRSDARYTLVNPTLCNAYEDMPLNRAEVAHERSRRVLRGVRRCADRH